MNHLKPWEICYFLGDKPAFRRRGQSNDILICKDYVWYVERPFGIKPFVCFESETPETLMFKVDLALLEDNNYEVEKPFIFPDNDL